jgi:hypothetical protein
MDIWGQAVPAGTVPTLDSPLGIRGREVTDGTRGRETASRGREAVGGICDREVVNGIRGCEAASRGRGRKIVSHVWGPAIASHTAIQHVDKIQSHDRGNRTFAQVEGCGP